MRSLPQSTLPHSGSCDLPARLIPRLLLRIEVQCGWRCVINPLLQVRTHYTLCGCVFLPHCFFSSRLRQHTGREGNEVRLVFTLSLHGHGPLSSHSPQRVGFVGNCHVDKDEDRLLPWLEHTHKCVCMQVGGSACVSCMRVCTQMIVLWQFMIVLQ